MRHLIETKETNDGMTALANIQKTLDQLKKTLESLSSNSNHIAVCNTLLTLQASFKQVTSKLAKTAESLAKKYSKDIGFDDTKIKVLQELADELNSNDYVVLMKNLVTIYKQNYLNLPSESRDELAGTLIREYSEIASYLSEVKEKISTQADDITTNSVNNKIKELENIVIKLNKLANTQLRNDGKYTSNASIFTLLTFGVSIKNNYNALKKVLHNLAEIFERCDLKEHRNVKKLTELSSLFDCESTLTKVMETLNQQKVSSSTISAEDKIKNHLNNSNELNAVMQKCTETAETALNLAEGVVDISNLNVTCGIFKKGLCKARVDMKPEIQKTVHEQRQDLSSSR